MATQVRMEVSKQVNAKVHYIAKTLDVKVSFVYEMITVAYLVDFSLEEAIERLHHYTDRDAYESDKIRDILPLKKD